MNLLGHVAIGGIKFDDINVNYMNRDGAADNEEDDTFKKVKSVVTIKSKGVEAVVGGGMVE